MLLACAGRATDDDFKANARGHLVRKEQFTSDVFTPNHLDRFVWYASMEVRTNPYNQVKPLVANGHLYIAVSLSGCHML